MIAPPASVKDHTWMTPKWSLMMCKSPIKTFKFRNLKLTKNQKLKINASTLAVQQGNTASACNEFNRIQTGP
jgi:hypothetical protein